MRLPMAPPKATAMDSTAAMKIFSFIIDTSTVSTLKEKIFELKINTKNRSFWFRIHFIRIRCTRYFVPPTRWRA